MSPGTEDATVPWLTPAREEPPLRRYLRTARARWRWILAALAICLAASAAYLAVAPKTYRAQAQILVTPVPSDDDRTFGLGVIRQSADPTRDVSTVSEFVTSVAVLREVARHRIVAGSPRELLDHVQVEPVAQSSVVSITASAGNPGQAARLASTFAAATVAVRTRQLHDQIDSVLPALRARAAGPRAPADVTKRVGAFEALRVAPDPTLVVSSPAEAPDSPASPNTKLTLAASLLVGLVVGLGGALALEALDPRLRREEQVRENFRLPILARVPQDPQAPRAEPMTPPRLSNVTAEAFRSLRATFAATREAGTEGRSVLITGATPSEGKSTTSLNFAYALAQAGSRVLLIESDLHRPALGRALGVEVTAGLGAVLVHGRTLDEAAITLPELGPNLRLVLAENVGTPLGDRLALPAARTLLAHAHELADYVLVDAPPLTEVSDVLPLAKQASDVVLVARLDRTQIPRLRELGELLSQNEITPAGVVIVGTEWRTGGYYYATDPSATTASTEGRAASSPSAP